MTMIFDKILFTKFWPSGYVETFPNRPDLNLNLSFQQQYDKIVKPYENSTHTCLEIGPGGGVWSNKFVDVFEKVIAIDVIAKPARLSSKITYYELDSFDYICSNIEDNNIDFVFSYGVFCHLPVSAQTEYVKNILRVLKNNGNAIIMFADWEAHPPDLTIIENKYDYKETAHQAGWFYMDKTIIADIMNINNITNYTDVFPEFRDRIIHFKKN